MSKKVLAVFGATGQQGRSVIEHVVADPELSQTYRVRAITRDVDSTRAKQLRNKHGVQVVQGDALDRASLEAALDGAHTVFAMTTPVFAPNGLEAEYTNGKAIVDAAVAKGVEYIVFSTLRFVSELSGGKYTRAAHCDAKALVERYIRGLHGRIRSAFVSPGFFMGNFHAMPFWAPQRGSDGGKETWVMTGHTSPGTQMPMLDAERDLGKFVGAILAEPERFEGETVCAAAALYTYEEQAAAFSEATGKRVVYRQVSFEEMKSRLPFAADGLLEGFSCIEEFGCYGPEGEKLVAWAVENARGTPLTLEEYLRAHPVRLE